MADDVVTYDYSPAAGAVYAASGSSVARYAVGRDDVVCDFDVRSVKIESASQGQVFRSGTADAFVVKDAASGYAYVAGMTDVESAAVFAFAVCNDESVHLCVVNAGDDHAETLVSRIDDRAVAFGIAFASARRISAQQRQIVSEKHFFRIDEFRDVHGSSACGCRRVHGGAYGCFGRRPAQSVVRIVSVEAVDVIIETRGGAGAGSGRAHRRHVRRRRRIG